MVLAMAAFAGGDAVIKVTTGAVPPGQVVALIGLLGALAFALALARQGRSALDPAFFHPAVMIRNLGEVVAACCFVTALSLVPLSLATMIFQGTPILVTAGAALFLRETVGPWRWGAVLAGIGGMAMILRPGLTGFDANALWALVAVFGMATRDLSTRFVPAEVTTIQLAAWGFASLVPAGALLAWLAGGAVWPTFGGWGLILGATVLTAIGYVSITLSLRLGEVSAVMPFRYTRILFAILLAMMFFGESLDMLTLTGVAILIGAGLVTLWREGRAQVH